MSLLRALQSTVWISISMTAMNMASVIASAEIRRVMKAVMRGNTPVYFMGQIFRVFWKKDKVRTDLKEDKTGTAFNFVEMDKNAAPNGEDAQKVRVDFGANYSVLLMMKKIMNTSRALKTARIWTAFPKNSSNLRM